MVIRCRANKECVPNLSILVSKGARTRAPASKVLTVTATVDALRGRLVSELSQINDQSKKIERRGDKSMDSMKVKCLPKTLSAFDAWVMVTIRLIAQMTQCVTNVRKQTIW
jgi:hypothetical protein